MGLEFRRRDYRAEEQAHSLWRARADTHPLSAAPSPSPLQVEESECGKDDFCDPLRANDGSMEVSASDLHREDISSEATAPTDLNSQLRVRKEWISFKRMLMQRFPVSKTSPISVASGVLVKSNKAIGKSSKDLHSGELDDDKKFDDEDVKVISQQECLSKLQGLKDEINQAWSADDRVTSLRLSIKVVRFLMDSSIIQFYPTLFVLATDTMDMLGDLVWNRIKQKAEITEENFKAGDICIDAKETCNNWFCKIGSVHELLPRIYLELALLPCWLFLHDHPENILQRLVEMTRGIADPLASAYCRMYLVQCSQRLPHHDTGFLITCINDLKLLLIRLTPAREAVNGNLSGNSGLLLALVEPTIEYIMRCLFKDLKQMEISKMLVALGMWRNQSILSKNYSCISIVLHCILKELPVGYICSNAVEFLHLIETTDDRSFDQCLNFKLLGHRLCELASEVNSVDLLVDKIIQVLSCYEDLYAYLMVADAYLDIILENRRGMFLNVILDEILDRARDKKIGENELVILQSVLLKILTHFGDIEKILALNHFIDILDMMNGSSRNSISMHILNMAIRNGQIQDPIVIEVLLEVAQALYDGLDFSNMRKDDYQHPSRLISRFVYMVDHGTEVESHLRFLAQCRGAFSSISELQENLVHSSNNLAVRAMRDGNSGISFVKSCLAFNEVTIPAIPINLRQLNLYIETAEVALLGGFVSHLDGLLNAAVNCLQMVDSVNAVQMAEDGDGAISLICKLCGMLVMVPGVLEQEIAYIPKRLLSFLDSQSWILPRMKAKVLSAIVFLSAALSQNQPPYHAVSKEVLCNYQLFVGVQSYHQELLSLSRLVLQGIVNIVMQESSKAVRGKMALESCNCIASSFMVCDETLKECSKLVEIAKSCLSADDKFLQSTLKFLDASHFHL
ncbi:hypothetical protein C2S53_017113 [Perilla frutescens var. hirtella]|uniref:Uncharacterized protein n=1 Tax=Perilla frutescens var. hirtella TaxID=608512 RepID=A0AAD4IWQ4_PERFH|nr:hypothetical protein C2S53_017113 [Perilla frutescens var. hirtella]